MVNVVRKGVTEENGLGVADAGKGKRSAEGEYPTPYIHLESHLNYHTGHVLEPWTVKEALLWSWFFRHVGPNQNQSITLHSCPENLTCMSPATSTNRITR